MKRLLVLVVLCALPACGSGSSDSSESSSGSGARAAGPEQSVEKLMRALDAGSCSSVKKLVVTPSAIDCGTVREAAGSFADDGIDLDETTYRAGAIEGSSSTVRIDWGNGDPRESYDVQKVDGVWRVVFDSAA